MDEHDPDRQSILFQYPTSLTEYRADVYLTDGRSKTVKVGKQVVRLKHAASSKMAFADSPNTNAMQALRSIGRKNVGDEEVKQIARAVPRKTKRRFHSPFAYQRLEQGDGQLSRPVLREGAAAMPLPYPTKAHEQPRTHLIHRW
jgi:hypothetical protein